MDDVAKNADRIIVMRGGRIIMDGAPAAVFDRADELIEAGLDVPFAAGVMRRLRQMGAIGTSVPSAYTLAEAAEILKKEKNNR